MTKENKKVTKSDLEAEEKKIQELMDEREQYRKVLEESVKEEREEFEKFKEEIEFNKKQDRLRDEGKLVTMARIIFHYQEEPGGLLQFTKQGIRYAFKDSQEYTVLKEIADHINSLSYPDRDLVREPGSKRATLKVVGKIPRCTATVLKTWEKEYDPKTDIPDQDDWKMNASRSYI